MVGVKSNAQPSNDVCSNAHMLCPGTTLNGTNISATSICTGATSEDSDCQQGGLWGAFGPCYNVENSVWYTFTTDNLGGTVVVTVGLSGCITTTDEMQGLIISATTPCDASSYSVVSNCIPNDNTSFEKIGTGMSVSSGYWTFPSTGLYMVKTDVGCTADGDDNVRIDVSATIDDSAYDLIARAFAAGYSGSTSNTANTTNYVNVTDVSNVKVSFGAGSITASSYIAGDTDYNFTSFTFIRLGDSQ